MQSPLWRFTLLGTAIATTLLMTYSPRQPDAPRPAINSTVSTTLKIVTAAHATVISNTLAPSVTVKNGGNATMSEPVDTGVKSVPQHVKIVPVLGKQTPAPESPPKNNGSAKSDPTPELPRGISSDIVTADQNCNNVGPMRTPLTPPPPVTGQIISFLPQAQAMELIPQSEQSANGKIDPDYIQNVRAVIHPDHAPERAYVVTLIPAGMNTYVGQRVQFISGHASPELACHYIPNLVIETTK